MNSYTVTVLGGTGFLGREIVVALLKAGFRVKVASRHPQQLALGEPGLGPVPVVCDVRKEIEVMAAVTGASAVVNAVSLYVEKGPLTFDAIHVEGASHVARACREAGVRHLVHISGIGASITSPSKYVRSRAHGEQNVRKLFPKAAVLRPSVLSAPDAGFAATLEAITRMPVVPLFGGGETRLQPVYVRDVARAVERTISMPDPAGKIVELGGSRVYSYRETLQVVMAHRRRKRLLLPVPFPWWHALATMLSLLPNPPVTHDQLYLMKEDNVVGQGVGTFADLGLEPLSLEDIVRQA